jgi:hypothetical protein
MDYVFTRTGATWAQQAYVKASNTRAYGGVGGAVALSSDGSTFAAGAIGDSSDASGVNGDQADTSLTSAGAVYVFMHASSTWSQQAYVKASNPEAGAWFGSSVALASDGSTLAVGAVAEASAATGVGGNQSDTSAPGAGAVYVLTWAGTTWTQQAYVKASNTAMGYNVGYSVALSSDGSTLAVSSDEEASAATGINGDQTSTSAPSSGAVYVLTRAARVRWLRVGGGCLWRAEPGEGRQRQPGPDHGSDGWRRRGLRHQGLGHRDEHVLRKQRLPVIGRVDACHRRPPRGQQRHRHRRRPVQHGGSKCRCRVRV